MSRWDATIVKDYGSKDNTSISKVLGLNFGWIIDSPY
jgi:hypothetical protein